ncbi:stage II sporulation protein M [Neosynechococcus sphagnicola]|uniref:stage II sporulation protein M n=1 Tax=Neosynechococcus sphagnicola TaxID=1501145 RepID=UPI000AEBE2FE|nr:stage II sporulation protein M [Neosynechococcus sphagnicola]
MNLQRWIGRRESDWQQLDKLLKQAETRKLPSLKAGQIRQLASLYRSVSADLARARTQALGEVLIRDLQNLTSRAYSQIYQGSRRQEWQAVQAFYCWGLPAMVQQTFAYTALATTIFALAALVSWWHSWQDPTFLALVVPADLISQVEDKGELWTGSIVGVEPLASSNIMINNLSVAFRVIAGGISAGIFTVLILAINGLLIGAIATLVAQNHLAYPFWAFVLPHGALELPAIFLAGGAGLLIARALLFPGIYRRADALRYYGQQAAQLVYGIIPLLVVAGIIEGFFSPESPDSRTDQVPGRHQFVNPVGVVLQSSIENPDF